MIGLLAAAESALLAEEHVFDLGAIREAVARECCLQVDEGTTNDNLHLYHYYYNDARDN